MACDKNINETLNVDFSSVSDEFNWLNNTQTPIQTIDGQLRLVPEAADSQFIRSLGVLDPTNNRIRLRVNADVFRPQASSHETFCATFGVYLGSALIDEFTLYLDALSSGDKVEYNFDRLYYYDDAGGAISLRITTPEGYENQLFLDYLISEDLNYCDDDVRNYFVLDGFLQDALGSVSSGVQLLEWVVDDVETLTPAFFTENPNPGSDPTVAWKFAKANIDGSDRNADVSDPNTFNPFVEEWGLAFEDVAGNHFGGKPTGTISGNSYGAGILQIGFLKPKILNGNLDQQDGAFFVDIDFTKNLKIVFNVLVNNTNVNVFDSPDVYRKYTILWDAAIQCAKQFYYNDVLDNDLFYDEILNGFLSGITGKETTETIVGCDESFAYNGQSGTFEFTIDLGTDIGEAGIDFNAYGVPDKFEIDWNGNTYSSGYRGSNSYDQQLLNMGVAPSEINTDSPSNGVGSLLFTKDMAQPSTALVRVTAPFSGTAWTIDGRCPAAPSQVPPTVSISTASVNITAGDVVPFDIVSSDSDGAVVAWFIDWGGEGTTNGTGVTPPIVNKTFTTFGTKIVTITVTDNDGLQATDTISVQIFGGQQYALTGQSSVDCNSISGMSGVLTVTSGNVTVTNDYGVFQGGGYSGVTLTIDGGDLENDESVVLGVGTYPYSSNKPSCTGGTGENFILIT